MESEAVVSLKARRGGADKPPFVPREMLPEGAFTNATAQKITRGTAASSIVTASSAAVAKKCVSIGTLFSSSSGPATTTTTTSSSSSSGQSLPATKRIMKELAEIAQGKASAWMYSGEGCHLFPDVDNIHVQKALIEGPIGTPFEGGVFALNISIPTNYPFQPNHEGAGRDCTGKSLRMDVFGRGMSFVSRRGQHSRTKGTHRGTDWYPV